MGGPTEKEIMCGASPPLGWWVLAQPFQELMEGWFMPRIEL